MSSAGLPSRRWTPHRTKVGEENLIEHPLARYVDQCELQVEQGRRSDNTLKEIRRYAKQGGPFSYWFGQPIAAVTYAPESGHVAEADGNRTRRERVAALPIGFEVRAGHQLRERFRGRL